MSTMTPSKRLSTVLNLDDENAGLGRTLLSERAADTIRSYISSGRVPEGTKITEREVSTLLGVSRAPARDALKRLESEGLVITRPGGRYVTTLTENDVRDLHEIRCSLETLAIGLAANRVTERDREIMDACMANLRQVALSGDSGEWTRCDMALHQSIWSAAANPHLLKLLESVLGPMFVLADRDKTHRERDVTRDVKDHQDLVDLVSSGNADAARAEMARHLERSLQSSLQTFRLSSDQHA
jgi:DNA-binding GntR family transcriptional regulator